MELVLWLKKTKNILNSEVVVFIQTLVFFHLKASSADQRAILILDTQAGTPKFEANTALMDIRLPSEKKKTLKHNASNAMQKESFMWL